MVGWMMMVVAAGALVTLFVLLSLRLRGNLELPESPPFPWRKSPLAPVGALTESGGKVRR
jgi:hypothetical protein